MGLFSIVVALVDIVKTIYVCWLIDFFKCIYMG